MLKLLDLEVVKEVMFAIGRLFSSLGVVYELWINGVLLIGLGLFLFYSKWIRKLMLRAA